MPARSKTLNLEGPQCLSCLLLELWRYRAPRLAWPCWRRPPPPSRYNWDRSRSATRPTRTGSITARLWRVHGGRVWASAEPEKSGLNHSPPLASMPSTSIQDTPQSVNVIDSATMKQQAVTTLGDALRNVPGITIAIGEGGTLAGDQF